MTQRDITGTIFNTQKFSIHDGIGIRTLIFMKGCPLRCTWCSNPESQSKDMEIMDVKVKCIGCGRCVKACINGAINPDTFAIDRHKCVKCGSCADACFANAKQRVGQRVSVEEIIHMVEKDRVFYNNSGGGITVGGGEPLLQEKFVEALLRRCKGVNIHTAIETCGYGKWEEIAPIFACTDQVFYDLKIMNPQKHEKLTGAAPHLILENAEKAANMGKEMVFRIPLITGLNDDPDDIERAGAFIKPLYQVNKKISVEILPYHDLGRDKYKWLGKEYEINENVKFKPKAVIECRKILESFALNVIQQPQENVSQQ